MSHLPSDVVRRIARWLRHPAAIAQVGRVCASWWRAMEADRRSWPGHLSPTDACDRCVLSHHRTPPSLSDDVAPFVCLYVRESVARDVIDRLRDALCRWPSTLCVRWNDDDDDRRAALKAAAVLNVIRHHAADHRCRLERLEWDTLRGPPLPSSGRSAWAMKLCVRELLHIPFLRTVRLDVRLDSVSPVTAHWLRATWEMAVRHWCDLDLTLRIENKGQSDNYVLYVLFRRWASFARDHGSATSLRHLTLTLRWSPTDESRLTGNTLGTLVDALLRVNVKEWELRLASFTLLDPFHEFGSALNGRPPVATMRRLRNACLDVRQAGLSDVDVERIVRVLRLRAPALRTLIVDGNLVA